MNASSFAARLAAFVADLTAKFAVPLHFNPEARLKAPMLTLLKGTTEITFIEHRTRNEQPIGRRSIQTIGNPLIYPTKLTEREHEDIAAQVRTLPAEVAQQMLDVIQARMQGGPPIRTNPAAVLRGIVRKYRTDPGSFDPSSGFHVADQRRRRTEAEARLREAAAVQRIGSVKMAACILPAPRQQTEGRRRFVDSAMKALQSDGNKKSPPATQQGSAGRMEDRHEFRPRAGQSRYVRG